MSLDMAHHEREEGGTFENMTSGGLLLEEGTSESAFRATVRNHLIVSYIIDGTTRVADLEAPAARVADALS